LGAEEAGRAESHLKREDERRTSTAPAPPSAGRPEANLSACFPVALSKETTVATGQLSPWSVCAALLGARESLRPTASGPTERERRVFVVVSPQRKEETERRRRRREG